MHPRFSDYKNVQIFDKVQSLHLKDLFDRDLTLINPVLIVLVKLVRGRVRDIGWQGIEMKLDGVTI